MKLMFLLIIESYSPISSKSFIFYLPSLKFYIMANPKILFQKLEVLEGGWNDRKAERGGKTNMGITLSTWRSMGYDKNGDGIIDVKDHKLITKEDVYNLFYKYFWKRWKQIIYKVKALPILS